MSALLGRVPARSVTSPLATEMGACRSGSPPQGSITSVQAIYVPADDHGPGPATTFAPDATTVLSRSIAELGIYPAVDPLESTSRIVDPMIIGEEHYNTAGVQEVLQRYKELQDIIAITGYGQSSAKPTSSSCRARKIQRFLSQPFHVWNSLPARRQIHSVEGSSPRL